MKKQFFRVKQLADQTLLRADRSESLNHDELKKADVKVENIHKVLSEINKKLPKSNEGSEKRKLKYYEYSLANSIKKLVPEGEKDSLLFDILADCGRIEMQLAEEQAQYESDVEQYVNNPINALLDKDLPNIYKQKKNLNKYILDKDSATSRYQNASKNGIQKDNLRGDMDEADVKVDQSRDALASEMFGLLRRENEISMYLLQLLKLQSSYHNSALKTLANIIPQLEEKIGTSEVKPIFGCDLAEHLRVTNKRIAYPLEICIATLSELGMSEEGLFRIAGGASKVKRLRLSIDSGCFSLPLIDAYRDVHVLASTLKSYLRELPEPLLTSKLYPSWMSAAKEPEENRIKVVQNLIEMLPQQNRDNLAYLIKFLSKLSKHPENKMTPSNIAIVMSPNLLFSHPSQTGADMKNCVAINTIVELLVINSDQLFSDEIFRHVSIKKEDLFERTQSYIDLVEYGMSESPRPQQRKKTKPAPAPPIKHEENISDHEISASPHPSGSSTLNRVKSRPLEKPKAKTTEEVYENVTHNKPNVPLVNLDNTKMVDHKYEPMQNLNVHMVKSKPVQQITLQLINSEANDTINAVDSSKPVAAPRNLIDIKSDAANVIEVDGEIVQVRRSSKDDLVDKPNKPAIPVRPPSLRSAMPRNIAEPDPALHKTTVYSMPHKQQPSLVNLKMQHAVGHDNQIAEKEKFLGHQPVPKTSLENKFDDINSNCESKPNKPEVPLKPPIMKSTEKLNFDSTEKINGNTKASHARTRSDGNIVDLHTEGLVNSALTQTPPSPRSLNKPSQPPPPPPINKAKVIPDTTDF